MNPFAQILSVYENNAYGADPQEPLVLVLRILRDDYTSGFDGTNPYRYALAQLAQYGPNTLIDKAAAQWSAQLVK